MKGRHFGRFVLLGAAAAGGLAILATASLASDDERSRGVGPGQCVSAPLDDTRVIDESTLYIDDYHGNAVLLHMTSQCLTDHEAVALKFFGSERICGPLDVDVTGSALTFPRPCIVGSVEALSKEEAKAYKHGR